MPKRVFWPVSLIVMGLVFLASNLSLLPREFWNLWPLMLIIIGLGGLLTSDREEWMEEPKTSSKKSTSKAAKSKAKKSAKKK